MSVADEIEKLRRLRESGSLTDEEFEAAKQRAISGTAPASADNGGTHRALWALVVAVLLAGAGVVFFLHEAGETLKLIAGTAAVAAGLAGAALGAMEDLGVLAIGAFGLGAIAIGAVVFVGLAPVIIPVALAVLAVVAIWAWLGEFFTG